MIDPLVATFAILALAVVGFMTNRLPLVVVALFVPVALWATGVLPLDEALGGFSDPIVLFIASLFVLDAWLYWKHRLLHTRFFFRFHREHHTFRDPTAFAGFAVGPVESLLTFWPIVLMAIPEAIHYGPLYLSLVIGFVLLNLYLHCGVTVRAFEAVLPPLLFNTSAFHNRHHANAEVNFGEAFTIWDRLCKTRAEDRAAGRTTAG